jgi:hypothetical protein
MTDLTMARIAGSIPSRPGPPTSRHSAVAALLRGLCAKVAARPKQRSLSYG